MLGVNVVLQVVHTGRQLTASNGKPYDIILVDEAQVRVTQAGRTNKHMGHCCGVSHLWFGKQPVQEAALAGCCTFVSPGRLPQTSLSCRWLG
jgi:hypothetical protein